MRAAEEALSVTTPRSISSDNTQATVKVLGEEYFLVSPVITHYGIECTWVALTEHNCLVSEKFTVK